MAVAVLAWSAELPAAVLALAAALVVAVPATRIDSLPVAALLCVGSGLICLGCLGGGLADAKPLRPDAAAGRPSASRLEDGRFEPAACLEPAACFKLSGGCDSVSAGLDPLAGHPPFAAEAALVGCVSPLPAVAGLAGCLRRWLLTKLPLVGCVSPLAGSSCVSSCGSVRLAPDLASSLVRGGLAPSLAGLPGLRFASEGAGGAASAEEEAEEGSACEGSASAREVSASVRAAAAAAAACAAAACAAAACAAAACVNVENGAGGTSTTPPGASTSGGRLAASGGGRRAPRGLAAATRCQRHAPPPGCSSAFH
eukprot:scaffold88631_cov45-Phaeocystis_antarctica.AAC.1